jgi:hypothetical protein
MAQVFRLRAAGNGRHRKVMRMLERLDPLSEEGAWA